MSGVLRGDRIEAVLLSVGVTKSRWAWFESKFGGPPDGDCTGCDERQELLNETGRDADLWMENVYAELGSTAAAAIAKIWAPVSWLRRQKNGQLQSGIPSAQTPTIKD